MPQPLRSIRLARKTLTCLPSEGRRGHAPTSSEGRANAQADDSSRSGLLKPEFDVSEDAANKAPQLTPSPRKLRKGAQPQASLLETKAGKGPGAGRGGPYSPSSASRVDRDELGNPNFNLFRGCTEIRLPTKTLKQAGGA
ncbi:hypothetical protein E5288_WYG009413 [Bos mutus]|uniref:Uncharacterized protein n=1 Tax=Bos mutus TaxID=72004 RepID=A0A6B0R8N8_9CETA|nr:hypothetical protein [Bos mutus]